ncbi:MAG: NADH-quinone oxidoreductase subunit NuoG [Janthinobacterium lividum]
MVKLTIDNLAIDVPQGTTVLQAAQQLGIEVPIFCYHPRLAIAGNCRMCLVEMEKSPKPIASCAMPASEGMVIHTTTPMVHNARRGVLEFLLINHPLDCPICDQGGECDLQDITVAYGPSTSRFKENKRAVPEKYMGPLIKTFMNRCIHCTRCVRFATEIAGVPDLGAIGRGEDMEITNYLDQTIGSELSGNLVDICPVGALTSRPYSFKGRPWDLVKTESIDVMDAVGSHIRIDTYGMKVIRVLPRLCEDINEEWISDETRHACDGLSQQRLDQPYVRRHGKLEAATWAEAFDTIRSKISSVHATQIAALAGDMADVESMLALKDLMTALESPHLDCRQKGEASFPQHRSSYLFNTTIAGIERADACLIIDSALRQEAPLVQARFRKRYLQGHFSAAYIGGDLPHDQNFTWPVENLGNSPELLDQILSGDHPFAKIFAQATYPMIIIGQSALQRSDGASILKKAQEIAEKYALVKEDWNGFNVVQQAASRIGGLDIGFIPGHQGKGTQDILKACQSGEISVIYLLGADEIEAPEFGTSFVIYQGHHGDRGAHRADVILPGAAYSEKEATYVNMEGRIQQTLQALLPPGDAKEDWRIIRALADKLGVTLPYQNLAQVRDAMTKTNSIFGAVDQITPALWEIFDTPTSALDSTPFAPHDFYFYQRNPISRASKTMADCRDQHDLLLKSGVSHYG